ncbi:DUF5313 family protein [Umezawaea sp. Da 62-37]|uniref:DUF5313 family protein n=1 Tax=Umezawaea sp. Da 62-37 TaxID=3075927 RepID=UPI0028F73E5B|nr:DUF5313 family protein [Umezawaea sp. Da 62-37]WNV88607.1 DUF5313 family protein [Umezawaea sp. Da 62-37]
MTPNPFLHLWYLIGGRLPQRHREWVFADVTRKDWLIRFTIRALLQVLPLSLGIGLVLVLALGSPIGLAVACGGIGLIVGVYFSLSYAAESVENRVTKYGYPRGSAGEYRRQHNDRAQADRYNATWRS